MSKYLSLIPAGLALFALSAKNAYAQIGTSTNIDPALIEDVFTSLVGTVLSFIGVVVTTVWPYLIGFAVLMAVILVVLRRINIARG